MAPLSGPPGDPLSSSAPVAAPSAALRDELAALGRELGPDLVPIRLLGTGRSARVYLAREPRLNRLVSVKVLSAELAGDRIARARFDREARAAAALNHANAVTVHRFGYTSAGVPYLVMQYVKGVTLEAKLAAEGVLPVAEARRVLGGIAGALAAAHRHGFIHRDLRPGNILCDEESGAVLVSDFGLAGVLPGGEAATRLTRAGSILGSMEYVSPEELRGEEASEASDVYALGLIGYDLLAGEGPYRPLEGANPGAVHLRAAARPLRSLRSDVDDGLATILERCLAKDPAKRPRAAYLAETLTGDGSKAAQERDLLADVLKRRLPQIVLVTAAAGFAVLEFIDQLVGNDVLPRVAYDISLCTYIYSIVAAGVIAWFHGTRGRQRIRPLELTVLGALAGAWLLTCFVVAFS